MAVSDRRCFWDNEVREYEIADVALKEGGALSRTCTPNPRQGMPDRIEVAKYSTLCGVLGIRIPLHPLDLD